MFGIGLAPKNYTTLTKVLSDKGYSLTDAHDIGLITRKENIYITDGRYIESVNKNLTIDDEIVAYDVKDLTKYFEQIKDKILDEIVKTMKSNYRKQIIDNIQEKMVMKDIGLILIQLYMKIKMFMLLMKKSM